MCSVALSPNQLIMIKLDLKKKKNRNKETWTTDMIK